MTKDIIPPIKSALRIKLLILSLLLCVIMGTSFTYGQVSPQDHKKHHPGKTGGPKGKGPGMGGGMMGGSKGGGMMGGKGGMGGMMDKMGAPKPKDLYPKLMNLPDLPMEERAKIEQEAYQRMMDGTDLLSVGLDDLFQGTSINDFKSMQSATAIMREGLAQFESGLAAKRALAEGKAPRNIATRWFKHEMNLLPPASAENGFRFFGMTPFHTSIMVLFFIFAVVMIWMYFFKMQRAAMLLKKLASVEPESASRSGTTSGSQSSVINPGLTSSNPSRPTTKSTVSKARPPIPLPKVASVSSPASSSSDDCCQDSVDECESEDKASDRPDISQGILRVAKRKLCRLRVAEIYQETPDVKTFRLIACHGGPLPFNYLPGQFLTLTLPVGEKSIKRSYTISSSPTQGYYCEVTIKGEEKGAGSRYMHDKIKEGDALEVHAPSGKFIFTGKEADDIVLIAGGVGITPMMSITRALTDMGWKGDIYFIVACRDPEHFIFESELKILQKRHSNLHLHVAMSRIEKDINSYHRGRLSKKSLAEWVPDIASRRIHICGAPAMMDSTKQMLAELGVPKDQIHSENFGSLHKPRVKATEREKAKNTATTAPVPDEGFTESTATEAADNKTTATVNFATSGKTTVLEPDETILDASDRIEVEIDNSCRVGMCGMCTVKLLSGQVTMEIEDGLELDDKEAGMILACQAKSSNDVTVEA